MPKIGRYSAILDTVFFLYADRDSAEMGDAVGGTGFLVALPSKRWPGEWSHIHGITNWHVAVAGGTACIRVNRHEGKPEVFEFDPSEWIFEPGGPDVAISPPLKLTPDHKSMYLDVHSFLLNKADETKDEVGPGDDVFMAGRFVDYDGVETNGPALRFGHISIISANVRQETGYTGRSIVADMHSRSGFSGSPVFVYRTLGSHFMEHAKGTFISGANHYLKCLGIHWGQFPEAWELKNPSKSTVQRQASLITDGAYVEGLSGMTCIVPAADIINLLNSPELDEMREKNEIERAKTLGDRRKQKPDE